MHELDDNALLQQYAEHNSETAFAAIVSRHVDKVYSVALRHTRNAHAAEEITQAVFVILAKKSGRLGAKVILSGWLYETARLTALTYIRSEIRRARREQEAHMQTALNENESDAWPHIAPLLDDALAGLSATDRYAVVLRYFDGKSLGEVGAALGASEDAAKKRVTRAVEKLRGFFTKHGVTLTSAVLTTAISANSVQAAPLGLAATVTAAATKGVVASGSTLTLIKGALKVMAWTKMKMVVVVGAGVLLAAGTTTIVVQKMASPSIDESLWKPDSRVFQTVPPILIIRPTQNDGVASSSVSKGEKAMRLNATVAELLSVAYGISESQIILPDGLPQDHFDLMLTLNSHPREALQAEIKKRFGLVARRETRDANSLTLKIRNPNAPGISRSAGGNAGSKSSGTQSSSSSGTLPRDIAAKIHAAPGAASGNQTTMNNQTMSDLAGYLKAQFGKTVVDQTGTTNRFNFKFQVQAQAGESKEAALHRSVLEQLGLELVPSVEPMEMLVVEKVK